LALRKKLEEMTRVDDVSRHFALLADVTREYPNTIMLLDSPHPIRRYTCLMHVLDFAEKPDYETIATHGRGEIFAAAAFAHWLLDKGLLVELNHDDARKGDIVLYFNEEGRFKHAGLLGSNRRVVSKWGIGHLYQHELFEVPESYGTTVRFFKGLPYDDAFDHFLQFAQERGMRFE
jgi:hypothetical protein